MLDKFFVSAILNLIHSAGHQLLEIINDLLDANKLASDDIVFNLASLVANLHYKVRMPINDVIGYSEILRENAAEQGRLNIIADWINPGRKIRSGFLFLTVF
jgi:hypothetical protein